MSGSTSLLVTLGHNSSACVARDFDFVIGYEQERLDRIKGSSAFPKAAVDLAVRHVAGTDDALVDQLFVTHWFDQFGTEAFVDDKYFDKSLLKRAPQVFTHTPELTHHDCHAWSVVDFHETEADGVPEGAMIIVADGFGNFQEVLSVYEWRYGSLRLKRRVYGYDQSVGLMYQYATSLAGMKENEDEYKFLGYMNNHRRSLRSELIAAGIKISNEIRQSWENPANSKPPRFNSREHGRIDLSQLRASRALWNARLSRALGSLPTDTMRESIGVIAQTALEQSILSLVPDGTKDLLVAGGCFMNVRLNDLLCQQVENSFTAMPLAGDQGVAFGMRRAILGSQYDLSDLDFGKRDEFVMTWDEEGVDVVDEREAPEFIAGLIRNDVIVNVVRSSMEFGSRALCRTSTLARPTNTNVDYINRLNNRNTVMPMAPVMTREVFESFFPEYEKKLVGSERYMITACSTRGMTADKLKLVAPGACHPDPYDAEKLSCRPQVVDPGSFEHELLCKLGGESMLINTSLNFHGEPIVFSMDDVLSLHRRWRERASTLSQIRTVFVHDTRRKLEV